jgi:hypothetical protein
MHEPGPPWPEMNAKDFAVETVESKRGCRNPKHFVLCAVECKRLDFVQIFYIRDVCADSCARANSSVLNACERAPTAQIKPRNRQFLGHLTYNEQQRRFSCLGPLNCDEQQKARPASNKASTGPEIGEATCHPLVLQDTILCGAALQFLRPLVRVRRLEPTRRIFSLSGPVDAICNPSIPHSRNWFVL